MPAILRAFDRTVAGIDAVFLSHLHLDQYDDAAKELLPKGIKMFVQEAVNHYALSRADLKAFIEEKGIASSVLVPADGESYTY